MQSTETCSEPGCSGSIRCRSLCNRHYQQRWREANAEKCRDAVKRSKAKHHERVRTYAARYDREHPEVRLASYQRNREKRLAYGARYPSLSAGFHLDHVMPIARGGSHSIGNLTAACARCNLSKGALTVMEWRMRQSA
ncbi:HNH endonuclease [Microbacterium algeriense]|uniref:HNH endonuclease n=1 Tax=Microbacterium algeriense TaxID=2615184 RepID=UPI003D735DC7